MASEWAERQRAIVSTREHWTTAPTFPVQRGGKNRHKHNAKWTLGRAPKIRRFFPELR